MFARPIEEPEAKSASQATPEQASKPLWSRLPSAFAVLILALATASPAVAQIVPGKAITIMVGAAPGGTTDISARLLADPLSKALGNPVLVENKPGASGNMAANLVARAKPTGHTLLMQYSGYHVGNPHLFDEIPWKLEDFTPVAMVMFAPHIIAVHPSVKANNLKELVALAKANPGQLKYGSAGAGSIQHLATELFAQMTGIKMAHVPYKGAAPAVADLLDGRIDLFNTTPPSLVAYIRTGRLKALAYTSDNRHPVLNDIPTSAESGLPGYKVASWFGILAPAKTPPDVIERLAAEIRKIVESDEFKRKVEERGGIAAYEGPEDFKALIAKEYEYWGKVIKSAGVKVEQE